MASSIPERRRTDFLSMLWLFFGGSFIGIVLIAIDWQSHGWPDLVLAFFASGFITLAFQHHKRQTLIIITIFALVFSVGILGQTAGRGLAILATAGIYGSDHSSRDYVYIENYLIIVIIWLLLGVPHRAFKYQLDLDGEGNAQRVLVRILVMAASLLTGAYILMLHFDNGPLNDVSMRALIPGIIFTVFLIVPTYRSVAKACWQRGIRGLFSPKPLAKGWIGALTELDIAFYQAANRLIARRKLEKASQMTSHNKDDSHKSASEPRSNNGSSSSSQKNSKPGINETAASRVNGRPTSKPRSNNGSGPSPQRNSRQRTKKM